MKPKTGLKENTKLYRFSHLVNAMEIHMSCGILLILYILILNTAVLSKLFVFVGVG